MKRALIGLAWLVVLVLCFLLYSLVMTFSNWPWTTTESHESGTVMGFEIGSSKLSSFENAITLQQQGQVLALELLDAPPTTYDEKFKGTDLARTDFDRVSTSNSWHVGLSGVNAWLILTFEGDRLARVERKDYRGPTE